MNKDSKDLVAEITERTGLAVQYGMSGKRSTTMCVGGEYLFFVEPNTEIELSSLVETLRSLQQTYRILGNGSNLLVSDAGILNWVIRLGKGFRSYTKTTDVCFWVGAGMPLMVLSRELSENGLSGLEFAGGIPASFGGAIRMNAGAHGGELAQVLSRVRFLTPTGKIDEKSIHELNFSYRRSDFGDGSIVVGAEIVLTASDPAKTKRLRADHLAERKKRQPLTSPSSGSVFKNLGSGDMTAGALLEKAGMKGKKIGGAEISELHANWIINPSKTATAQDVTSLIRSCKEAVHEKLHLNIETEIISWY